jgi:hypothetical protein
MKEKIARWYRQGLWTAEMVRNAVDKGIITAENYAEIVGQEVQS